MFIFTSNFIFGTDLQSSDDDGGSVRPKRVKSVPCISFRFQHFINIILIHRCLTEHEQVIAGLTTGNDAPLQVREGGISGRGVFALQPRYRRGPGCVNTRPLASFPAPRSRLSRRNTTSTTRARIYLKPASPSRTKATSAGTPRVSSTSWADTEPCAKVEREDLRPMQYQGEVADRVCGM